MSGTKRNWRGRAAGRGRGGGGAGGYTSAAPPPAGGDDDGGDGGGGEGLANTVLTVELSERRLARVHVWKGKPLVDVREFYMDRATGEPRPTRKGISLAQEQFEALIAASPRILATLHSLHPPAAATAGSEAAAAASAAPPSAKRPAAAPPEAASPGTAAPVSAPVPVVALPVAAPVAAAPPAVVCAEPMAY